MARFLKTIFKLLNFRFWTSMLVDKHQRRPAGVTPLLEAAESASYSAQPPTSIHASLWWRDMKQVVYLLAGWTRASVTTTWWGRARPSRATPPPSCHFRMRITATAAAYRCHTWLPSIRTPIITLTPLEGGSTREIPNTRDGPML